MSARRFLTIASGIALFCTNAQAATPQLGPGAAIEVRRTTIIVSNMENSLKLYRDALGMRVTHDNKDVIVSGVSLPAGVPGNHTHLVLLRSDADRTGWIGLIQYYDPPLPKPQRATPGRIGIGDHIVVLNTNEVDRRCALVAKVPGVVMTGALGDHVYAPTSTRGSLTIRGCYFLDPDGAFFELVETRPS